MWQDGAHLGDNNFAGWNQLADDGGSRQNLLFLS
jgi:hypothetical protein